jgi:hypothetical protein
MPPGSFLQRLDYGIVKVPHEDVRHGGLLEEKLS